MGGHGGLNILPQKRWHVYNQDNREKVAKDEAAYEEIQKAKRAKHQQAESEYRHARMLARARGVPQDMQPPHVDLTDESSPQELLASSDSSVAVTDQLAAALEPGHLSHEPEQQQQQQQQQQRQQQQHAAAQLTTCGTAMQPVEREAQSLQPAEPVEQSLKQSDLSVGAHKKRRDDSHMNFWREDEVKAGNAEVKADQVNERRRRGDAATQTSDARFDERFQLGHAMHGRSHTPWYVTTPVQAMPSNGGSQQQASSRPLNGAILLAAAAQPPTAAVASPAKQSNVDPAQSSEGKAQCSSKGARHKAKKHRKERKKEKERDAVRTGSLSKSKNSVSESKLRLNAAQLKASVKAMRRERVAREVQERLRQQNLLRHEFRK